ncbi:MAG: LytR/AlgR family response regulator transcription factor [Saprospiraceae bacterium]
MIKCIIIEDEPIAMEIMQDYIKEIPQMELIGTFSDALYAMEFLRKNEVDLIFLDLHLPKLNGFDFLKTLKNPPKIIVTTAYHQHALEGYELNVVDYLLKPIEFSRLLQAANKLDFNIASIQSSANERRAVDLPFLFFNVNKKKVKVFLKDIYFIESLKEYVKIHLKESYLITQFQIGEIEKKLTNLDLIRIHRSYLVVQSKIEAYSSSTIEINGKELPIGRTYKKSVLQKIAAHQNDS